MNRFAGELLLAAVADEVPKHMRNAPSIKDALPQTEIPVKHYPGLGIAPLIRRV